jgi:hypothetical protein
MRARGPGRELREMVEAELAAVGITDIEYDKTNGGHQRIRYCLRGRQRSIILPSTPSDHRSFLNARAFVRRSLAEARQ